MIARSTAVLAVADVRETVTFYRDRLGFAERWLWGDPPTFGCIGAGPIEVFLARQPGLAGRVEGHQHFFWTEDVDALHEQHVAAGAPIVEPIENKPWNVREYAVRDCNGYELRFAGPAGYERPVTATDALPVDVRIDAGVPDYETYASLFRSVNWSIDEPAMRSALTQTTAGVLATDTRDGQVVGMVRATGDGKYYMLWDVIVRPSHQGQKIGAAMVERTLEELRRTGAPSGSFVGLFTGRPGFYEKVGFNRSNGMSRAL
jgi:GNAT superfamily N-acetyltransferase/catechol 2,3-dioxygenase-like lactoylglutathione lyase family enzyme